MKLVILSKLSVLRNLLISINLIAVFVLAGSYSLAMSPNGNCEGYQTLFDGESDSLNAIHAIKGLQSSDRCLIAFQSCSHDKSKDVDGNKIVTEVGSCDIFVTESDGNKYRKVGGDGEVWNLEAWLPNGKILVNRWPREKMLGESGKKIDLLVLSLDGSAEVIYSYSENYMGWTKYEVSPNGNELVFDHVDVDGYHTWLYNFSSQTLKQISNQAMSSIWAPDGKSIYFRILHADPKTDGNLYQMDREGNILGEFLKFEPKQVAIGGPIPVVDPSGTNMAFWRVLENEDGFVEEAIQLINLETKKVSTLAKGLKQVHHLSFSPSGQYVSFSSYVDAKQNWLLHTVNLETAEVFSPENTIGGLSAGVYGWSEDESQVLTLLQVEGGDNPSIDLVWRDIVSGETTAITK